MSSYTYSVEGDFINGISPSQLDSEIDTSSITKILLGVTVKGDDVIIQFDQSLDAPTEEDTLDTIVENHIPGINDPPEDEDGETNTETTDYFKINISATNNDGGYMLRRFQIENDDGTGNIVSGTPNETGTAVSGGSGYIELDGSANATDNFYFRYWIKITSGTGINQVRRITSYDGTSKFATISSWTINPDNTSVYALHGDECVGIFFDESSDEWLFGYTNRVPDSSVSPTGLIDLRTKKLTATDEIDTTSGYLINGNPLDTDDINEGSTNLYYTETRVSANTDVVANSAHRVATNNPHSVSLTQLGLDDTDDITEGSINLYYTEARVSANTDVSANTTHRGRTDNPHNTTIEQITPTTTKGDILVENGSNVVRLPVGMDNGMLLVSNDATSTGLEWITPQSTDSGVVSTVVTDRKSVGTNGGTFLDNAWRTRDLNNLDDSEGGTTSTPSNGGIALDSTNSRVIIPSGTYFMIAQATAYRVNENRARFQVVGASETTKIETIADVSGSLGGTYFDITTTTTSYRIWFDVDNGSSAPSSGGRTLLEVDISSNDSAENVATALSNTINTQSSFYASIRTNIFVIIRNKFIGNVADAVDNDTGFTITKLNDGNTTSSTVDISLSIFAKDSAQGTAVNANITTQFTFTETKICELQHQCVDTKAGDGFGVAAGIAGLDEQYSTIFFHRIKIGSIN